MSVTPNPIVAAREAETQRDHSRATERGQRISHLVDAVLDSIAGQGIVLNRKQMRPVLFHVLADDVYGNASIDIPW